MLTRFDNAISVVDLATRSEIAHLPMYNPEPASVVRGRRFLYDARTTSSHGDSACASCHIFGDFDSLAWDLGNPDDAPAQQSRPVRQSRPPVPTGSRFPTTLKGPMTTQSLRGMANHGPMHWRGDRTGGNDAPTAQPDSGTFDEEAAFKKFNVAFQGLLGRQRASSRSGRMQAFTDFILQIAYPPNPIRNLDNSLTADQRRDEHFFISLGADGSRPAAVGHVPKHAPAATCSIRTATASSAWRSPASSAPTGSTRFENEIAALQDSAPAQSLSKGGKVRCVARRQFLSHRSDPVHG